ncbi:hypothetical protein GCM10010464_78730 [Pseudonocardia yunnanensis]
MSNPSNNAHVSGSRDPITVIHGRRKSSSADTARKNSGFAANPNPTPATKPDACSNTSRTTPSVVPGTTVDRTTTVCRPDDPANARPTAAVPARNAPKSYAHPTCGVGNVKKMIESETPPNSTPDDASNPPARNSSTRAREISTKLTS